VKSEQPGKAYEPITWSEEVFILLQVHHPPLRQVPQAVIRRRLLLLHLSHHHRHHRYHHNLSVLPVDTRTLMPDRCLHIPPEAVAFNLWPSQPVTHRTTMAEVVYTTLSPHGKQRIKSMLCSITKRHRRRLHHRRFMLTSNRLRGARMSLGHHPRQRRRGRRQYLRPSCRHNNSSSLWGMGPRHRRLRCLTIAFRRR
jgi:hypothetical protein